MALVTVATWWRSSSQPDTVKSPNSTEQVRSYE
uniref:Uncharacterized protein n=1 Tax=Myoviridae sp. ct5Xl4 TaxID=2826613 RepID=A0A8S5M1I3_9CAUD|nr:MAG TPA: hypothetical protein [Myoviridae sp. ct5Xl4]